MASLIVFWSRARPSIEPEIDPPTPKNFPPIDACPMTVAACSSDKLWFFAKSLTIWPILETALLCSIDFP